MNATDLGYSLKNIPLTSRYNYLKLLTEKVENFVKRMRWKAHFFERPGKDNEIDHSSTTFGFKSNSTPPQHESLTAFENDLYEMIRNIAFRNHTNKFLKKLETDVEKINSSKDMLISADKTTNIYEMSPEQYEKLLNENITKSYQKANMSILKEIDVETKELAKTLDLQNKMERFANRRAFVTLKDHKENFTSKLPCRLINPAKSEIGAVAKKFIKLT